MYQTMSDRDPGRGAIHSVKEAGKTMYQKILLAYDGSETGRTALKQGAELAALCKAEVCLLAVIAPDDGTLLAEAAAPSDLPLRIEEEVAGVLAAGAKILENKGLKVESRLVRGNPAREIGFAARDIHADLVVVGHRDQGTLSRWWKGSVGADLLTHAPCSVLIAVSHPDQD
jgi:nucleotide-binding universal stress UspA family protein